MIKQYDTAAEPNGSGTDLDASYRLAETIKGRFAYVPQLGWLYWDGKRWASDIDGIEIRSAAKESARQWTIRCAMSDEPFRSKRLHDAQVLESGGHIEQAVKLAESDKRLAIASDKLDGDPLLLNVLNGTIDLRTGSLRAHRRDDLISKLAPVTYTPGARHPMLDKYLATLDAAAPRFSPFLRRCIGAALTGDSSPESLLLLQGDGGSGKTTLAEGVAATMGDYAVKIPFESLCLSYRGRSGGGASPDIARLRGARFAYASEGDQSAKLDAGLVKMLTGGERCTARCLYKNPMTFAQTWKLFMVSNFDPRADSEDTGLWRRIIKLPFPVVPPERRDPAVKHALTHDPNAQAALLAWAVSGCVEWQRNGGGRHGLAVPECVASATEFYRKNQDTLSTWLDDLFAGGARLDPDAITPVRDLRRQYEEWCDESGFTPCLGRRFNEFLLAKGLARTRGHGGTRSWKGIRIGDSG